MADIAPPRLLEILPARPPTPPRETHNEVDAPRTQASLIAGRCSSLDPRTSLQTPPSAQSLLSSNNTKTSSTGSSRLKRVEFSTQADFKEPPVYPDSTGNSFGQHGHTTPPVAVLLPSSSASRPSKSILKVTTYEAISPSAPTNIADMLASTVQQLAGADRDSKLDAYLMLARALKTSDNLPDRIALQSKMSLFTHFIQRDITTSKTPEGTLDSTLVIAALDLLNTFLRFPAIASTLSNDFGVFIVDHCIRSFETSCVPRDVLRPLMRVVGLQSFSAKVMTSDRVGRLVSALHNLDEQYESKNIIIMRSIIYRHLVKNNKMLMAVHLDWLPDLLADMVSTGPHIREAAISFGLEAAFSLGRERPVSQRVMELLQTMVEEDRYLDYYANRLRAMTKNKAESSSVPQVWSVIMLFMRNLEKWDYFTAWLRIIQSCFNSTDYRTKDEANYAWSRFAYALVRENQALPKKVLTILTQAITSQLRRRNSGKQADDTRMAVLGCACNLFYYTMRDIKEVDNIWDNSVKPVILQLLEQSAAGDTTRERRKANLASACAILTGLIDCSTPRPWKEDRIAKSPVVAPEDLPAVDAKWIRRNASRVFDLVGPILVQNFLELATPRSATQILWRSVVGAVSVAAAKEVKVSPETAAFVGHAFSLILKLWTNGVPGVNDAINTTANGGINDADRTFATAQFLGAVREFLLTMVDSLGCLPFTEKQLSKDERNTFVPVATPSQRAGKGHSVSRTPLRHLFSILSSLPPGVHDDDDFADFVESVFAPFFSAKSVKGRRTLAYEMLQMSPMDALCPYGPWQVVATQISSSIAPQSSSGGGGSSNGSGSNSSKGGHMGAMGNSHHYFQMSLSPGVGGSDVSPAGHEYREVVRVLERGLRSTPKLPWARWQSLFCTLCDRVREDAGDAGLAICVLDPLAKSIMELYSHPISPAVSPTALRAVSELVSLASHPRDRQAVEAAKRRLWGSAIAASGPLAPFDPFDHLYKLVNNSLGQQYTEYDSHKAEFTDFGIATLKELAGFFSRSNEQLSIKALSSIQYGLACWIQDEDTKLIRQSPASEAVNSVWNVVMSLLQRANETSGLPLATLEPLMCAVFSSMHRHIVNSALDMWTRLFGDQVGEVDYPEKLKTILMTLQAFVDIPIPGLDITHMESNGAQQPMFVDSQAGLDAVVTLSSAEPINEMATPRPSPTKRHETPILTPLAATSPSYVNRSSNDSARKKSKKDMLKKDKLGYTPPRPRHDDSQIEFTTIESPSAQQNSGCIPTSAAMGGHEGDIAAAEESQVLTDRQREVRERQRETNALYSDIMSSSPSGKAVARRMAARATAAEVPSSLPRLTVQPPSDQPDDKEKQLLYPVLEDVALPEQPRAATPDQTSAEDDKQTKIGGIGYTDDDYIASTPTPRRGQALVFPVVNDNENDPPSSPPEPRRYPLLPDISSRSRSSSILDDWQFSSSPPSGSPIAARHTNPEPELSLEGAFEARLRDHQEKIEDAVKERPESTEQRKEQQALVLPEVSEASGHQDNDNTEVAMEDLPNAVPDAPAAAAEPVSLSAILRVEISPMVDKTNKVFVMPATPMQTRRRSALSQESSQNSPNEDFLISGGSFESPVQASAPQSLPRTLRRGKKATSSTPSTRMVAQSSPIRRSSGSLSGNNSSHNSRRRYKLMAMPPPSMRDISFRMTDGEERSMLRLATELDLMNKKSQSRSSPAPSAPPATRSSSQAKDVSESEDSQAYDCITVRTSLEKIAEIDGQELSAVNSPQSSQEDSQQQTLSQRSRRRKRKRSASARAEEKKVQTTALVESTSSPSGSRQYARPRRHNSRQTSSPTPAPRQSINSTTTDDRTVSVSTPKATSSVPEDQEVQSQLALELEVHSNRERMDSEAHEGKPEGGDLRDMIDLTKAVDASVDSPVMEVVEIDTGSSNDAEPDSVMEVVEVVGDGERPGKKPRLAGILSMLRGSLSLLQSATLSRADVSEIEDVCMDVKRALYDAERRGRDTE